VAVHCPTKLTWQDWNYEKMLTPTRLWLTLSNGAVVPVGAHEIDAGECTAIARYSADTRRVWGCAIISIIRNVELEVLATPHSIAGTK
jgi:hypothetical protein